MRCVCDYVRTPFRVPIWQHRLVSFRCIIKEHTYRYGLDFCNAIIDRSVEPESVFRSQVLALKVQSLTSVDTMMVYYDLKHINPVLIGLVPGTMATLYNIQLRTSKHGNIYAMSVALSDLEIVSLGTTDLATPPLSSLGDIPNVLLYDLNEAYIQGSLSQRTACVKGMFTLVQHVSLQLKCFTCQSLFVNNRCTNVCCMEEKAVLRASAR